MHSEIGEAAGAVWRSLEANGKMSRDQLKAKTGLGSDMLSLALGWLAREEKILMQKIGDKKIDVALK